MIDLMDLRRPKTIEEALKDVAESLIDDNSIEVTISKELMLEMLQLLIKLKHS